MKLKLTLVSILLGCVSSVHAHLIDLTPGGFNSNNPPQILTDWYHNVRPGLFLLDDSLFTITGLGTPTVTFSWDFRGTPAIFQWLIVDSDAAAFGNFYHVSLSQSKTGEASVIIDGELPIERIVPFGHPPFETPETGSTFLLLMLSLLALVTYQRQWARKQS